MKWVKLLVGIGIALLISGVALAQTADGVSGSMRFSRFLDVYAGNNWNSGNFTINVYSGPYFTVNDALRINFEAGGSWHIQVAVDYVREDGMAGLTPAAGKVLEAFEIGPDNAQGHSYKTVDFHVLDAWYNLLWDTSSVDESEANPILFFQWKIADLAGAAIGGHYYAYAINFQLVSP